LLMVVLLRMEHTGWMPVGAGRSCLVR